MRIGICGGTFDPFHRGHLDPILHARETLQWERVLYVPAFVQPFKRDRDTVAGHHRFAMAAAATLDYDGLMVTPMELERGAVSYTVDTLEQLRQEYRDDTIDWIIGDDNLDRLLEWRSLDRILELANFVVLTRVRGVAAHPAVPETLRQRVTVAESRSISGTMVFAENPSVPVSSTDIRRRVREGEPIEDLVPPPVSRYIHHYGLYRKGQT